MINQDFLQDCFCYSLFLKNTEFSNGFIEGFLDFGTTPDATSIKIVMHGKIGSYLGEKSKQYINDMQKD